MSIAKDPIIEIPNLNMTSRTKKQRFRDVAAFLPRISVQLIAARPIPRELLNALYLRLTPSQRSLFSLGFSKIFRNNRTISGRSGIWTVEFAGRTIRMPLNSERFWLDWDLAVSLVGHDLEVVETYSNLIKSPKPPTIFLDVGANYGTHSLLFLVHNIETLSFEPNTSCRGYFHDLCALNNVTPRLCNVALGKDSGYINLSYPPKDTWLGSTDAETIVTIGRSDELKTERVKQRPLDDYVAELRGKRILLKIDTEGSEYDVLQGASTILSELRPLIIFESWRSPQRARVFEFFLENHYRIVKLPWNPAIPTESLAPIEFMTTVTTNFAALPIEHVWG